MMSDTKKDDGGPAFPAATNGPQPGITGDFFVSWPHHGMSLRDYFAAHAPPVDQHFVFVGEPMPAPPPVRVVAVTGYEGDRAVFWPNAVPHFSGDARRHRKATDDEIAAEKDYREAVKIVSRRYLLAREAAWRYMYADAMLAARKATP